MITALIVDDEPGAIARLAELLDEFPEVAVIGTASDVAEPLPIGRAATLRLGRLLPG